MPDVPRVLTSLPQGERRIARLARGLLNRLEALASRDTKARVTPIIDMLDELAERLGDLANRGEAPASIPEAHIAQEDFDQSLDDGLVFGAPRTRCNDRTLLPQKRELAHNRSGCNKSSCKRLVQLLYALVPEPAEGLRLLYPPSR